MVDMDHFKAINDRYGHLVGDKVLSAAAGYLINCTRSYDKVFRYGGEEFVICTPGLSQEEALILAERLRQGIAENPVSHDGEEIHVTASFGIATLFPISLWKNASNEPTRPCMRPSPPEEIARAPGPAKPSFRRRSREGDQLSLVVRADQ